MSEKKCPGRSRSKAQTCSASIEHWQRTGAQEAPQLPGMFPIPWIATLGGGTLFATSRLCVPLRTSLLQDYPGSTAGSLPMRLEVHLNMSWHQLSVLVNSIPLPAPSSQQLKPGTRDSHSRPRLAPTSCVLSCKRSLPERTGWSWRLSPLTLVTSTATRKHHRHLQPFTKVLPQASLPTRLLEHLLSNFMTAAAATHFCHWCCPCNIWKPTGFLEKSWLGF